MVSDPQAPAVCSTSQRPISGCCLCEYLCTSCHVLRPNGQLQTDWPRVTLSASWLQEGPHTHRPDPTASAPVRCSEGCGPGSRISFSDKHSSGSRVPSALAFTFCYPRKGHIYKCLEFDLKTLFTGFQGNYS